jgi:hypothetical protein
MALIDMGDPAVFEGGLIAIAVSRLPLAEPLVVKATAGVVAYYEGSANPEAVTRLRSHLVSTAQRMIEADPDCIRPADRPGDAPWVLIDHEALELS